MPAVEQLSIEILGRLDPSVMQTVNTVREKLRDIGADARTSSEVMKRTYAQMFDGVGQGAKEQFAQAKDAAGNFQSFMSNVKSTFTGVFAVDVAKEFFQVAIEGAKELAVVMKDAGIEAATMEQMKLELSIELGKGGVPATKDIVDEWINKLQYFSDTTTIQMKDAADAFRGAVATGYTPAAAFDMIKHLTDIAAATVPGGMTPSEHFKQLQEEYMTAIKGGNLMEKVIRPLEASGVQIRPFLEKKLSIEPGKLGALGTNLSEEELKTIEEGLRQLYKDVKKGQVPAHLLQEFITESTAPGGKYAGAAAAMGKSAIGGWSTMLDKWQTIMRGIGTMELGPFEAIVNKINSSFTSAAYERVQSFFDGMAKKIDAMFSPQLVSMFDEFATTLGKQDWSGVAKSGNEAIEATAKMMKDMEPFIKWLAQDIPKDIQALLELTTAFEHFFDWIEKTIKKLAAFTLGPSAKDVSAAQLSAEIAQKEKSMDTSERLRVEHERVAAAQANNVEALQKLNDSLKTVTGNDLVHFNEAIDAATSALTQMTAGMAQMAQMASMGLGAGGTSGAGGFGLGSGYGGEGTAGAGGPIRAEAYGPSQGEYTHSTNYGPSGAHLQAGDYAVSPDMAAGHHLGQMFSFQDASGHTITGRYADLSYKTAGVPNSRTIEQWNGRDLGHVSNLQWLQFGGIIRKPTIAGLGEAGPEAVVPLNGNGGGLGGITLHYSPVIHGFGDIGGLLRSHAEELLQQLEAALSNRNAANALV